MIALRIAIFGLAGLVACVPAADPASPDAAVIADANGFADASGFADAFADAEVFVDAEVFPDADVDAGVVFMPCGSAGSACTTHAECGTPETAPGNCDSCPDYYRALCFAETCTTPAPLENGDVHELSFSVDANVPVIASLVWMAVARDTPSGMAIDCADVLAGDVDLANACYPILDVRYREILQPGDTYSIVLGSFASGLPTMFIVLGYGDTRGRGPILGVSCTEYQVGAPGVGVVRFEGDPMHRR